MENPTKMDDLGVPIFSETSIIFLFLPQHGDDPIWLMFFKGFETHQQKTKKTPGDSGVGGQLFVN